MALHTCCPSEPPPSISPYTYYVTLYSIMYFYICYTRFFLDGTAWPAAPGITTVRWPLIRFHP